MLQKLIYYLTSYQLRALTARVLADIKDPESEKQDLKNRAKMMTIFIKTLESTTDVLSCWNEQIWLSTIESASIHADKSITFKFNSGLEVRVSR